MSVVTQAIVARGELPFLHVYDRNESAIRLYENLGWRRRRAVTVSFVQPA
jgi:predicted GNAT family acetyltransferase